MDDGKCQVSWRYLGTERTDTFKNGKALAQSMVREKRREVLREQRAKNARRTFEEQLAEENKGELVFFAEEVNGKTGEIKVPLTKKISVTVENIKEMKERNASFLAEIARLCRWAVVRGREFADWIVGKCRPAAERIEKEESLNEKRRREKSFFPVIAGKSRN